MSKSSSEQTADFLLGLLPSLLPKPVDSVAKSAIDTFRGSLDSLLSQPRLKKELLEAAQKAESDFRAKAKEQLKSDELTQAVASFPLFDRELFQSTLQSLPEHLNEDFLASHLQTYIADDWKGRFTPAELREGVTIYLNCLRIQLLKVEGFANLVIRLATLRTDARSEEIFAVVNELLQLVNILVERMNIQTNVLTSLFTIPPPVLDFTGRETQLAQLKASFKNGAVIIGVSGGSGVGKTELARKLAQEITDDYPDARMSIDLRGTSENPLTTEEAMRRILEPFFPNQRLSDNPEQLKGLYQRTFSTQKALLLLDNATNAAQVRALIPPAPSAAIITSRQHFSLTEFGLSEPLRLDVLSLENSRELLQRASPKLKEVSDEEVGELSRLCGHLPLALRVVASLLNDRPDWKLRNLLELLIDERTRLQRLKRPDDPELDVEAAIGLSYNLLPDEIKDRFLALGVFSGLAWFQTASAIWGIEKKEEVDHTLGVLLNRSLLNTYIAPYHAVDSNEIIVLNCYVLHDLTRLFVNVRLSEDVNLAKNAIERHANYFLDLGASASKKVVDDRFPNSLDFFRAIWPDLYLAWKRMHPTQEIWPRPIAANQWIEEFYSKCSNIFSLGIPAHQRIPILELGLETVKSSIKTEDSDETEVFPKGVSYVPTEVIYLSQLGKAYADNGKPSEGIPLIEKSLQILGEFNEKANLVNENKFIFSRTVGLLGIAYFLSGDLDKAKRNFKLELTLALESGDKKSEATSYGHIANIFVLQKRFQIAIAFYKRQLALSQKEGYIDDECDALGNMGVAFGHLGEPQKSLEFHEQSLRIAHEIGDWRRIGERLSNIGACNDALRNYAKAIDNYEQALYFLHALGYRKAEGETLIDLGTVHRNNGEVDKALKIWKEALDILNQIEDPLAEKIEEQIEWYSRLFMIEDFTRDVIRSYLTRQPQAEEYFEEVSIMVNDSRLPNEIQALAKVLQKILVGIKNPDLSQLPDELSKIVNEELAK